MWVRSRRRRGERRVTVEQPRGRGSYILRPILLTAREIRRWISGLRGNQNDNVPVPDGQTGWMAHAGEACRRGATGHKPAQAALASSVCVQGPDFLFPLPLDRHGYFTCIESQTVVPPRALEEEDAEACRLL